LTVLLDESVPRLLKNHLGEFSIVTVHEMGWTGMKNGKLLAAAGQQFTIFITADKISAINKILLATPYPLYFFPPIKFRWF
jgi:hypothetical protein